jgi:hypothetical protein
MGHAVVGGQRLGEGGRIPAEHGRPVAQPRGSRGGARERRVEAELTEFIVEYAGRVLVHAGVVWDRDVCGERRGDQAIAVFLQHRIVCRPREGRISSESVDQGGGPVFGGGYRSSSVCSGGGGG